MSDAGRPEASPSGPPGAGKWSHASSVATVALVYLTLQGVVGFCQIESWPLTHSPMFRSIPKETKRYRFEAENVSGRRLELEPRDFAKMKRRQLRALIKRHLTSKRTRNPETFCRGMFRGYNAGKAPGEQLVRLVVLKDLLAPHGEGSPRALETTNIYTCLDGGLARVRPPPPERTQPEVLSPAAAVRSRSFQVELAPIVLEAEHYTGYAAGTGTAGETAWTIVPSYDAGGERAVDSLPDTGVSTGDRLSGPRLYYSLQIGATGTYFVWVRMLGRGGTNNSIHMGWDGRPLTLGGRGVSADAGTWEWVNRVATRPRAEVLSVEVGSPGLHTLHLWAREDGVAVDQILLTKERDYLPQRAETSAPPPPEVSSAREQ